MAHVEYFSKYGEWSPQDIEYGPPEDVGEHLDWARRYQDTLPKNDPLWEQYRRRQDEELRKMGRQIPAYSPPIPQKIPFRPYTGPRGLLASTDTTVPFSQPSPLQAFTKPEFTQPLAALTRQATGGFQGEGAGLDPAAINAAMGSQITPTGDDVAFGPQGVGGFKYSKPSGISIPVTPPGLTNFQDFLDRVGPVQSGTRDAYYMPDGTVRNAAGDIVSTGSLLDPTGGLAATDPNLQGITPFSMASTTFTPPGRTPQSGAPSTGAEARVLKDFISRTGVTDTPYQDAIDKTGNPVMQDLLGHFDLSTIPGGRIGNTIREVFEDTDDNLADYIRDVQIDKFKQDNPNATIDDVVDEVLSGSKTFLMESDTDFGEKIGKAKQSDKVMISKALGINLPADTVQLKDWSPEEINAALQERTELSLGDTLEDMAVGDTEVPPGVSVADTGGFIQELLGNIDKARTIGGGKVGVNRRGITFTVPTKTQSVVTAGPTVNAPPPNIAALAAQAQAAQTAQADAESRAVQAQIETTRGMLEASRDRGGVSMAEIMASIAAENARRAGGMGMYGGYGGGESMAEIQSDIDFAGATGGLVD